MKSIIVLLLILAGGVAMSVSADNGVLALKPDELRQLELESIPPGLCKRRQRVLPADIDRYARQPHCR